MLSEIAAGPASTASSSDAQPASATDAPRQWFDIWHTALLATARARYCDTAVGEDLAWLVAPVLDGFHYGYLATHDALWLRLLIDWTDAWAGRGVAEPDGCVGWPTAGAAGTDVDGLNGFYADSLLGEVVAIRPVVLTAATILKSPALERQFGQKARDYILMAQTIFEKWHRRRTWRSFGDQAISVVLPYGIDRTTAEWTENEPRADSLHLGFSHPTNKANLVAMSLLAMADATGDPKYRDDAAAWFRLMKSRLHVQGSDIYRIWNYWEPAGPWDYNAVGLPKHWVGMHPNPGYYEIDVRAITIAYEHGLVFTAGDIDRLIRTAQVSGRQWSALAPYSPAIRVQFERSLKADGWDALWLVPWYLTWLAAPTGGRHEGLPP